MSGSSSGECEAYAARADVERIYGSVNVAKWADADNLLNAQDKDARVEWALCLATERINNRMRTGPYVVPFSTVPLEIVDLCATWAGVILYLSPRGVTDADEAANHELSLQEKWVQTQIRRIMAGQVRLDLELRCTTYPKVIPSG